MKILNLDQLALPKRILKIDGVEHPLREISVQEFLDELAAVKQKEQAALNGEGEVEVERSMGDSVQLMMDAICKAVPTLDRARVAQMNLDQLTAVVKFLRGEMDEKLLEGAEGSEGPKG